MDSDLFYRSLFDTMPVAVSIVADGKIVFANPATLSLLAATHSEQVLGHPITEFIHLLDQTRSQTRLNKAGPEWSNTPSQFRLRAANGEMKMLLSSSQSIAYEGRDAILITGMDMTAQAEMAEQLRVSELNFRRLFENMQDVYYRTDAKGVVQMVGPGVRNVLGYEPSEIEGKTAESYYPQAADSDAVKKAIMEDGKVADFPGQMVRKDGRVIDIAITSRAIYDENGAFAGIEGIYRDVTQRKMMERELQRLATTDPLTNIANRRSFLEQAEHIFKSTQRYHDSITLLMLDLDLFKAINDKYGHLGGDKVLTRFAQTVALELRDSDVFGRLGGEEFCVLLQHASKDEAMTVAERIRTRVQELDFEDPDGALFKLTVSIGVTTNFEGDERLAKLLERADKALYTAKHSGRNKVVWFS
ncbi:sensor domain-containing diguanylate cyclase [Undibacterium sp. Ren11W]|uniref:sensor domain-containing diguanylate cyclase n=1 Tax=Undibacterium sp. Ren11W TaxID=3413045 RepID=UPI003BF0CA04